LAHGVIKRNAEHLDEEVDNVAGEVALRPAPIAAFDEQVSQTLAGYRIPVVLSPVLKLAKHFKHCIILA